MFFHWTSRREDHGTTRKASMMRNHEQPDLSFADRTDVRSFRRLFFHLSNGPIAAPNVRYRGIVACLALCRLVLPFSRSRKIAMLAHATGRPSCPRPRPFFLHSTGRRSIDGFLLSGPTLARHGFS